MLARTSGTGNRLPDWYEIDRLLGLDPQEALWPDTSRALFSLAATLRET